MIKEKEPKVHIEAYVESQYGERGEPDRDRGPDGREAGAWKTLACAIRICQQRTYCPSSRIVSALHMVCSPPCRSESMSQPRERGSLAPLPSESALVPLSPRGSCSGGRQLKVCETGCFMAYVMRIERLSSPLAVEEGREEGETAGRKGGRVSSTSSPFPSATQDSPCFETKADIV